MKSFIALALILCSFAINSTLSGQDSTSLKQLIFDRKYREAIALGTQEWANDSLNPQTCYFLGIAYSSLKQFDQAITAFEKSEALLPGNKSVLMNLADCYCEVADIGAAEIILTDLLKTDSTDTFVWLQLAQVYQRQSDIDKAARIYSRLWSEDSLNIWYPRQLGNMMSRNERYKAAIPYLETVVAVDSSDRASFLRLGQAYINLKAFEKIPMLDKAIRQDSTEPLLYRYRGGLWFSIGKFDFAYDNLKIAFELGDSSSFVSRHLGISLFQLAKYDEAQQVLLRTVKVDSLDSEAWYYLGFSYKWTEDLPKASECLKKALSLAISPATGSIYRGLGLICNLQRDLKTAMVYYEKALEYEPTDAYPLSQLGLLVEQTSRDQDLALKYYERFLKEYTGNDRHLIEYVKYRIQAINEKLFMEGKVKKK